MHNCTCTSLIFSKRITQFLSVGSYMATEWVRIELLFLLSKSIMWYMPTYYKLTSFYSHSIEAIGGNNLFLFQQDIMRKVGC